MRSGYVTCSRTVYSATYENVSIRRSNPPAFAPHDRYSLSQHCTQSRAPAKCGSRSPHRCVDRSGYGPVPRCRDGKSLRAKNGFQASAQILLPPDPDDRGVQAAAVDLSSGRRIAATLEAAAVYPDQAIYLQGLRPAWIAGRLPMTTSALAMNLFIVRAFMSPRSCIVMTRRFTRRAVRSALSD